MFRRWCHNVIALTITASSGWCHYTVYSVLLYVTSNSLIEAASEDGAIMTHIQGFILELGITSLVSTPHTVFTACIVTFSTAKSSLQLAPEIVP